MGFIHTHEFQQADIIRLESELNNLWCELKTSNIPQAIRVKLEETLTQCEEQFKSAISGQSAFKELETTLQQCDRDLALAAIQQAENELPKSEKGTGNFLALDNMRKEVESGELTPLRARHEVKRIVRHRAT